MVKEDKKVWKDKYFTRLRTCLGKYQKALLINVDNVTSMQMMQVRAGLRGTAEMMMGKNTMMRKVISTQDDDNWSAVLPFVKQNMGFVFTNDELNNVRDIIQSNQKNTAAKVGVIAPCDFILEAQQTTLGPEKTQFFQALNLKTKITRNCIELEQKTQLITKGEKVGASEATLLQLLNIKPFYFGINIVKVYENGSVFQPEILDITPDIIRKNFMEGVQKVAALSCAINYPTLPAMPYMIGNGFRNLLAVAFASNVSFKEAEDFKNMAQSVAANVVVEERKEDKKEEVKEAEPEEDESDEEMGLGMFDED
ncbi:hypothetical protein SNEBB_003820 [Seison nebaliae]|nr:hypothetical protein SNEBB_003820 [Seison nebaliae]